MRCSTNDLLSSLSQRDVKLWVENGQLRFKALRGVISPQEIQQLRESKTQIVKLLMQAQSSSEVRLEARQVGCVIPLTDIQLGMWNYFNDNKEKSWRMCISAVRIRGPLDAVLLENSVEVVVRRHESLRTTIVSVDGNPRQEVDSTCKYHFDVVDLSPRPVTEEQLRRLADEFADERIDLSVGPLFSAKLLRLSRTDHVLILALDHIISDAESNAILCAEVWSLYGHATQKVQFSLPPISVQFADYAVWQENTYDVWRRNHESYWRQRLNGAPKTQIPIDVGLESADPAVGVRLTIPFGGALSESMHEVARREATLVAIVMLTVYVAVVSRWCDEQDMLVSFVLNGRTRRELVMMIGYLAEHIPIRIQMTKDDSFIDLLARIKKEFSDACEHQPLGRLPNIIPGYSTDLNFNWVSVVVPSIAEFSQISDQKITIEPFPCMRKPLPSKFGSFFIESAEGISWMVEYRPDMLTARTIERIGRLMRCFAEAFVRQPKVRITSLTMEV